MNKGFTLIELLAVIIIISLIGLLSIVSIGKIVGNSKEDLYQSQIILIEKAARSWGAENIDKLPDAGECIYLTLGSLKAYGLLSDNIIDPRDNSKLDDNMKIKISTTANTYGNLVIDYETNVTDVTNCRFMYGEYTLINGEAFSNKIKNLINGSATNLDTKIKAVVFLSAGQIPTGFSRENFTSQSNVDISENGDGSVLGYAINDVIYVYSDGILKAHSNSNKMFYGLTGLVSIDFKGLDTQNVSSMTSMFESCTSLKSIDLSSFDTSNTVNVNKMFKGCTSLRNLNLVGFSINKIVTGNSTDMFSECSNINITLNSNIVDFITTKLEDEDIEVNLTIK